MFHYRTAIFYQQNVTVYKWLVRICQFINLAMFYHNLVFAILGYAAPSTPLARTYQMTPRHTAVGGSTSFT